MEYHKKIEGAFTESDFELIHAVFDTKESMENGILVHLDHEQKLIFEQADEYKVHVALSSNNSKRSQVQIENMLISV